jgi:5-methylcytosine-specific restriction endonuclease McrA
LAIKITKALRGSDYSLSAPGVRGVGLNETLQIVEIILSAKESHRASTILKKLKHLHKYHPSTIEINKSAIIRSCQDYNENTCNCFYPDIKNTDYFCRIKRDKYLQETDYRNTPEYKAWRTAVFERDKYTCQECGLFHCVLNAHHIKPYKKYPKLRFDISNGVTLCFNCHQQKHKRQAA